MTDQEIDELGDKFGWFNDDRQQCFEYKQFIAFTRALLSRAIPEGHVVVPKEPTIEMIAALGFMGDVAMAIGHAAISETIANNYRSALLAAPAPEGEAAPANKEG